MVEGDRKQTKYLSLCLDIRGLPCLVVGGGAVACRKARKLADAGGNVTIVAPEITSAVPGALVKKRRFRTDDLRGAAIVIAATDDSRLNAQIADAARQAGSWVNVADEPKSGNILFPAVLERGLLSIAVSTSGACPAFAQRVRDRLEEHFGWEFTQLVGLLSRLRTEWEPAAVAAGIPESRRAEAWREVVSLPLLQHIREGNVSEALELAQRTLESFMKSADQSAGQEGAPPGETRSDRTADR